MKIKGGWVAALFILAGLVIGELIGEVASGVDWLSWLSMGETFGLEEPVKLNLNVFYIEFALRIKINLASIVGVIISAFIYRKTIK